MSRNNYSTYAHSVLSAATIALSYLDTPDGLRSNWSMRDTEDIAQAIDFAICDVWGVSTPAWDQKHLDVLDALTLLGEIARQELWQQNENEWRRALDGLNK